LPELPEVFTIATELNATVTNKTIKSIEIRHLPLLKNKKSPDINGLNIKTINQHGKYIQVYFSSNYNALIHLRMTGQLFIAPNDYKPDKHVHIIITFVEGAGNPLIYRDIRKFGTWHFFDKTQPHYNYINAGPDALRCDFNTFKKIKNQHPKQKIKAFLLDQTNIAGVGNIYADEICFSLNIDPESACKQIAAKPLYATIQAILKLAIKNKGTSVSDYLTSNLAKGNFQNLLHVYQQSHCHQCQSPIKKKKVAGRSTHYCPQCQAS
jgi:formamidopyrimidine-DNA glycosylase